MSDAVYDNKGQLEQIRSGLIEGERIIAVYDAIGAGTGFIGLTDRRIIIQDKSYVGKRFAITSIPYGKVSSVSVISNKSWAGQFFSSGTIAITVGTHTYEIEFRGSDKAHQVHNLILSRAS
ncbi:PH domain-containing protein [Actinoplanes sp. DH11]|uniref:PH domain-containing protein n=1 Tax=Actinoplanes sp. DH11 TaxID=2857011 RepID=UPI001E3FEC61|nr:PH domain-containing protein [Actinoplanes sp. DH11]